MKRNVTECDRCGQEIARGGRQVVTKAHHDKTHDLCERCFSEFEEFLSYKMVQSGEVPRGYKKVAKPCPHHVPCAEPWGCSGTEIVPNSDPRQAVPKGF